MKLFINGKEAVAGQEVDCHNSGKAVLIGWTEPRKTSIHKSGLVDVQFSDGGTGKYFPSDIGGKFIHMTRIDKIRSMTTEEIAQQIIKYNIIDDFCKSDCDDPEFGCPHATECCVKWLNEEVEDADKNI